MQALVNDGPDQNYLEDRAKPNITFPTYAITATSIRYWRLTTLLATPPASRQ
jgi:hypothetical protein